MLLMSCRDESWGSIQYGVNNLEGCAGVQLLLCRQFDIARAMRHGLRPAAVREIENAIHPALHECFGKIPGLGFRKAPSFRCDICQLIEAAKKVARSNYAEKFAAYLNETRNNEHTRLSYDVAGVFQKYLDAIGENHGRRLTEQMVRATAVMQKIRTFIITPSVQAVEPTPEENMVEPRSSDDYLEHVADEIALLRRQMNGAGKSNLRIVR